MAADQAGLTAREAEVLNLLAVGLTDAEIAERLVLSVGTVKWYNRQIYDKLGVRSRTQAAAVARGAASPLDVEQRSICSVLPAPVTSFIGRRRELADLKRLFELARLVSLTGPPGTGKTRLATELATQLSPKFAGGVVFVPLAPLRGPTSVLPAIGQALDISEPRSGTLADAIYASLRVKPVLIVFDNFEHLLPAATLVADLLAAVPTLRVLATSREALRLYGEHEYSIMPLAVPDLRADEPEVLAFDSVQLFVDRAQAASPEFELGPKNAAAVAAICVHLDGLPLAIELAAARVKLNPPPTLLIRLSSRLQALTGGPRDAPARQQTLRDTLAWSYDLLPTEEQRLFARLGIFVGGCTLEAVEAVCGEDELDVNAGLESLLKKSLLQLETGIDGQSRFYMLETIREYALERLLVAGEADTLAERHALTFLDLAERAAAHHYQRSAVQWLPLLEADHDNLRAALRGTLVSDTTAQRSLRLIAALARFWRLYSHFSEARTWLNAALQLPGAGAPTLARAYALFGVSMSAYLQGDYAACRAYNQEALAIGQTLGDDELVAKVLAMLGQVATETGDYDRAPTLFHQSYDMAVRIGDTFAIADARMQLAWADMRVGNLTRARDWLKESLLLFEQLDDPINITFVLSGLGEVAIRQGKPTEALEPLHRSLAIRTAQADRWGLGATYGSLAWAEQLIGDLKAARHYLVKSLCLRQEVGDPGGLAWCLEKLAEIEAEEGRGARAVQLYGAAAALRASIQSVIDPADQPRYRSIVAQLRAELGNVMFTEAWRAGGLLSAEEAAAWALVDEN